MVQASAAALRRLGRRRGGDPAAALLRCGVVPSSSSYSAPGTLLPLKQPVGDCGACRRSFSSSAWLGPRLWRSLHRRQSAAAAATATAWEAHHSTRKSSMATVSSEPDTSASQSEILHFIKSTFGTLEGQNHCWLNCMNDTWKTLNQGVYLILLYESCGTSDSHGKLSSAFQRLKYLQQRYPRLTVFAMEYGSDISSLQSQTVHTVMKEYFTFPILMSDKDFTHNQEFLGKKKRFLKNPCISVDEDGDRIFISDSNHHRVIISNSNGTILDYIGCSPGFEDGEFESAKFLRPAASFYNTAEDCLYIVDSENHAVRKADLGRRMLETVYPVSSKSSSGIWSWIVDKLGLRREDAPSENFIADSIAFPWHLLNITEDDFLVADRNFEASWILSVSTGQKQEIGRGIAEEMESYQQIIHERCALLKDMNMNWSSSAKEHSDLLGKIPFKELVSSVARFQKYIIFCDADGQRVLKHDLDTNGTSNIQFSNFGVLGLPYWFVCHLERVSTRGHSIGKFQEHTRKVNVLPGRCNIKVSVDIPADTQLAAPLVESCIWRQVRGSGAEVSGFDEPSTSTEKVGIAQQWYDEIDNLAFSEVPEEPTVHEGDENLSDGSYQEQRRAHFNCVVNVSPGTCELVASAALYLKIDSAKDDHGEQKSLVKRIIQCQRREDHAGVELLMESCKDSRDLTIMKPVHLRLMLECADHPAGTTNKETISSESSFEINISLD
uniref:NHL repeat-containing protein 2 n=1 Tax=Oryza rufipogon TaxID=4529 RepID=A0A0E0QE21_ORYRU